MGPQRGQWDPKGSKWNKTGTHFFPVCIQFEPNWTIETQVGPISKVGGGGWISKGKGKTPLGEKGKGKAAARADDVLSSFPPYYQAARTHDRTETEIDFPVGLTSQPSTFPTP